MAAAAAHPEQGSLTNSFNWRSIVVPAVVSVVTFAVMGYVDNALFDPFFFDPIHASDNPTVAAYKAWSNDNFGFLHDFWGFVEEGQGILNMWPFSEWLEPYYPSEGVDLTSALADYGVVDAGAEVATEAAVGGAAAVEGAAGSSDYVETIMDSDYSEYDY